MEEGRGMGPSLTITTMCFEVRYVFLLCVSMKEVASECPFYILMHTNSYFFLIHFLFISFYLFSCQRNIQHLILTYVTLSLADTHWSQSFGQSAGMEPASWTQRTFLRRSPNTTQLSNLRGSSVAERY